jgi:hypothetical protein
MTDQSIGTPAPHQLNTLFKRPDQVRDPLYVVTVVFNSQRYRSRWRLWQDFEKRCAEAGAVLYTVEVAFGAREFAITSADNPRHVQLRTWSELWLKEAAVNIGVSRLPPQAQWIAYVDADSRPVRDDWANETIHALQHHACVQMWSQYHCLDSKMELSTTSHSFMASYLNGWPTLPPKASKADGYYPYPKAGAAARRSWPGPPGLAWAWRKDAWTQVGGLLDVCILGSADWYMACGLIGQIDENVVPTKFSADYRAAIYDWQDRAKVIRRDIGMVRGLWVHYWHGSMAKRGYATRNKILMDTGYSPVRDLKRDWQGLYSFTDRAPIALRDGVRSYLAGRDEDQL